MPLPQSPLSNNSLPQPEDDVTKQARSSLDEALAKLDACVHCGLCLPACPTYEVTGSEAESPRGRLYLMKGYLSGEDTRFTADNIAPHIDQCLGCQACETVCPSGVDYHTILGETRQRLNEQPVGIKATLQRWVKRLALRYVLPNNILLAIATAGLAGLQKLGVFTLLSSPANPSQQLRRLAMLAPELSMWRGEALKTGRVFSPKQANGQTVTLFLGCVMNHWFGRIQQATVKALCAQGYKVVIPHQQTCCGALAHHGGHLDIAKPLASQNLNAFNQQTGAITDKPVAIVVNSAGCGSTLQTAPSLADNNTAWPAPVMDVMALLAKTPLREGGKVQSLRVAYHAACHLHHAQKIQQQPVNVLAQLAGVTLIPLENASQCCGSAGVYNAEHPELADEVLALKMATIYDVDADLLVSGNPGCLLQLAYGLKKDNSGMHLAHPVELVAGQYGDEVIARIERY